MKRLDYESPSPPTPKGRGWLGWVILALWGSGILAVIVTIVLVIVAAFREAITMFKN